jgi:hypothetical protein
MKLHVVLAIGLAIGFIVPTFAQQKEAFFGLVGGALSKSSWTTGAPCAVMRTVDICRPFDG